MTGRRTAAVDGDADRLHFEDLVPGRTFDLGSATLSAEQIVAFAAQWDPQEFHLDEQTAREAGTGGLIASGWQTAALWMRLYVTTVIARAAMLPAPGVEELRWLRPVRPGMRLHGRAVILDARRSERSPERGRVRLRGELADDDGALVMTMTAYGRARLREPGVATDAGGGTT